MVNNNVYTNLMARENLRYAAETVEKVERRPDLFTALEHKTRLEASEDWKRRRPHVPYDKSLKILRKTISFGRRTWDFKHVPSEKYPLQLYYHPLTIYRYQIIKQADLVLAMLLLGHEFSRELKRRNFNFDPITTGTRPLTLHQSIMAAEVGDMAKPAARVATLMNLGDVAGNTKTAAILPPWEECGWYSSMGSRGCATIPAD